ncbi:MAG: amino acid ABC transporter permease [Suilimivivens sp.]
MPDLFNISYIKEYFPQIMSNFPVTLEITVSSFILGVTLALAFALIKMKKIPVLYQVELFLVSLIRGTPMVIQLYLSFYGIPILIKYLNYFFEWDFDIYDLPAMVYVIACFTINEAAYNSEVIRAAFGSIDKSQREAAKALGMNSFQVLVRVIIPEAFTVALPTLINSLISLMKSTSLAFTCEVIDITAKGKILAGRSYRYFEVYVTLALIYWASTIVIERGGHWLEEKWKIPGGSST